MGPSPLLTTCHSHVTLRVRVRGIEVGRVGHSRLSMRRMSVVCGEMIHFTDTKGDVKNCLRAGKLSASQARRLAAF